MSVIALSSAPGRPSLATVPGSERPGFLRRAAEAGALPVGRMEHRTALEVLSIDIDVYEVRVAGQVVRLSPRQVELLAVFLAAPGKVGTELLRNVRNRGWTLLQP